MQEKYRRDPVQAPLLPEGASGLALQDQEKDEFVLCLSPKLLLAANRP